MASWWSRSVEKLAIKLRLKYFKAQGQMLAHADDVIANLALVRGACGAAHPSCTGTCALMRAALFGRRRCVTTSDGR